MFRRNILDISVKSENELISKHKEDTGVGSGLDDSKCVPYISQYSDCSDANACSGCTRCSCNEKGKWECQRVTECLREDGASAVDDLVLENALDVLYEGLEKKENKGPGSLVPSPSTPDEDLLLVPDKRNDIEEQLRILLGRQKRSVNDDNNNASIKFYETVDEINEDTLKNLNSTGTLEAHKVHIQDMGQMSRRTDIDDHYNTSDLSALHIKYNKPHELEHHVAENNIDSKHPTEDKINGLSHHEIHKILGNYSQITKNKDLSKLVVNELTRGSERIGDKHAVPVSNITFTPENDTLTAMTFIAGNLLNKLWDMEKDANEGSFETEVMKHEKINDLLELFKEPLSLRQEKFLKNALEKLSRVIDTNKDINNISLCANIEEPETTKPVIYNCTDKSKLIKVNSSEKIDNKINSAIFKNKSKATANAINKINDVLNLMKEYEHLQKKINDMKSLTESNVRKSTTVEENVSINENVSMNLFGNILDKITKLLSPKNKIYKRIQTYNILRKDDIAKKNIENLFNINLANMTMGTKDKMIIDYLSSIEKHPKCFFTQLQKPVVTPMSNVESGILYNLSEFFKIKSFTDLLRIVNDKPSTVKYSSTIYSTTTNSPTSSRQNIATDNELRINSKTTVRTLESAKERLKNDLKIIIQDLFDLQKEHGIKTKNNINIADALPCIYNILKSDNDPVKDNLKNVVASTSLNKISSFIDSLTLDMKFMSPNRRSNTNISLRPKSAIVWERAIKNLHKKSPKSSRRFLNDNPKTYKELKDTMDSVYSTGNTYKSFAIQSGVAPPERLILLKTLQADVKRYINVLETINKSLTLVSRLPSENQNEFIEFFDNAAMNINLDKKLVEMVIKFKGRALAREITKPKARKMTENNQPLIMVPKWEDAYDKNEFKVKRDQIMNQLMMNRLKLYIKTKKRTEIDLNTNANYNIAKRILFHLENENIALAKELYKVFLENKLTEYHDKESLENTGKETTHTKVLAFKQPLVRVEDPNKIKMLTQDYILKQLWNLKE